MAKRKKKGTRKSKAPKLTALDRIDLRYKRKRLADAKRQLGNAKLSPSEHDKHLKTARELQAGINRLTAKEAK